ncbi:MAG: ABC transporter ATP-binding protein [Candidatus Vogelbacteria bacterium]|nr:ABC transporter ATP-binding protein [Candidatus Vogelbacteria bacterium]
MIKTKNLTKKYGVGELEIVALNDINVEIANGEFVAIIGPSGAGKSTLLYQMSLLDSPTAGEVFLAGRATSLLVEKDKALLRLNELGYVFQDYALLPELSALDNVALPIMMQGWSKKDARAKAERALTRIGMSDRLNNLPAQLSGGQQQRVAIARAIAHDPHILFADEPTANLDSANGRLVMDAFDALHDEGQTIVMVTHEDEYARRAHRIISLKDGEIVGDEVSPPSRRGFRSEQA